MTEVTNLKGIERGRAEFAFDRADSVPQNLKESYKSHVKSFPMLVKTNGLGAALAFLYSKRDKENGVYALIGQHIYEWLKEDKLKIITLDKVADFKELPNEVVKLESESYRALTVEVLAFFSWLRRFAEGLIDSGE